MRLSEFPLYGTVVGAGTLFLPNQLIGRRNRAIYYRAGRSCLLIYWPHSAVSAYSFSSKTSAGEGITGAVTSLLRQENRQYYYHAFISLRFCRVWCGINLCCMINQFPDRVN